MSAYEIQRKIDTLRASPYPDAHEQLLDILTLLADRVTALESRVESTQATARHADDSAGRAHLADGLHHHG